MQGMGRQGFDSQGMRRWMCNAIAELEPDGELSIGALDVDSAFTERLDVLELPQEDLAV
jgi:hypothetical protein